MCKFLMIFLDLLVDIFWLVNRLIMKYKSNLIVLEINNYKILSTSENNTIRQYAATILRQKIERIWSKLDNDLKNGIKTICLQVATIIILRFFILDWQIVVIDSTTNWYIKTYKYNTGQINYKLIFFSKTLTVQNTL